MLFKDLDFTKVKELSTVNNIEQATHWLALHDESGGFDGITVDKLYPLYYAVTEDKFIIMNDYEKIGNWFDSHKGMFVNLEFSK